LAEAKRTLPELLIDWIIILPNFMKQFLKSFLAFYLKILSKFVLFAHKPTIIAIAGSTNKTFTKDAIKKELLEMGSSVTANPKSFNTEIGLPLAILKLPSGYNSFRKWLPILYQSLFSIFKSYTKYLVLELGISNKDDMKYLLGLVKPDIAVITDITQRYIDSFSDMDELVDEYAYLVEMMGKERMIVLNNDNNRIKLLIPRSKANIITFGTDSNSTYHCFDIYKLIHGQKFKVKINNRIIEYEIPYHGLHHIYSFLTALIINDYVNKTEKI
jgi:UDP-N-acetylmuramoyl-tripeptide--D-alanyl-D-alanine ligase